ncbi:2600_t:CDS:2, partial [Racocetra persica]
NSRSTEELPHRAPLRSVISPIFMPGNKVLVVRSIVPSPQSTIKNDANMERNLQLVAWGLSALAQGPPPKKKVAKPRPKPVELFMIHLADIKEEDKPPLPPSLDAKRAITDYLHEMNK